MNRTTFCLTVLCAAVLLSTPDAPAQNNIKLAQSGMQFLSIVSDAHAAAIGGAMTAVSLGSASLFFNPATMANTDKLFDLGASYNQWIADIKHTTFHGSFRPANGDYGVFGVTGQIVDYGKIQGTRVADTKDGYVDTEELKPTAVAIGIGYAKALSEAFSVGVHVKWARQNLGTSIIPDANGLDQLKKNKAEVVAFDFGTIFKTGLKSLAFGMTVRNFSQEVSFQDESFPLPLTFALGLSLDAMDFLQDRSMVNAVMVSVDAIHNRDYKEQLFFGVDCGMLNVLALRAGYVTGADESGVSFGFGLKQFGLEADFAYTPFGVFDNVQRFSIRYSM
jgi:hypothetical protein